MFCYLSFWFSIYYLNSQKNLFLLAIMISIEGIVFYFNHLTCIFLAMVFLHAKILWSVFSNYLFFSFFVCVCVCGSWHVFMALKLQLKLTTKECSTFSFMEFIYILYIPRLPDIGWKYLINLLEILWEGSLMALADFLLSMMFHCSFYQSFSEDLVLESLFHLRQISSALWINLMFLFLLESKKIHHRGKG